MNLWASVLKWWRKLRKRQTAKHSSRALESEARGGVVVVAMAPSYDDLTESLRAKLTRQLESLAREVMRFTYLGRKASSEAISAESHRWLNGPSLVLFFGHGSKSAFLTAPELGSKRVMKKDREHGELLTANDAGSWEDVGFVGFCCSSATEFGRSVRSSEQRRRFIGFEDDILFPTREDEIEEVCEPICDFIADLTKGGLHDGSAIDLLRLYEQSLVEQFHGVAVAMCLEDHLDKLDRRV